jgi:hypothetical protein
MAYQGAGVSETPDVVAPRRDALGWVCFIVHIAILTFIVTGWAIRPLLAAYLVFLPAVALHWRLNRNACVLNNLESMMRTGRWRNPANHEEGAWLKTLIHDVTGLNLTIGQVDAISYAVMAVLWAVALWHWMGW